VKNRCGRRPSLIALAGFEGKYSSDDYQKFPHNSKMENMDE